MAEWGHFHVSVIERASGDSVEHTHRPTREELVSNPTRSNNSIGFIGFIAALTSVIRVARRASPTRRRPQPAAACYATEPRRQRDNRDQRHH